MTFVVHHRRTPVRCDTGTDTAVVPLQDPAIKEMAENIARDPAFAQMTAALQQSMPPGGAAGMPAAGAAAGPAAAAFDPSQYMEAMSGVLQNPAFMNMAEQLGSKIMQVPPCACSAHQFSAPTKLARWEHTVAD